ncbi:MAG: methylmalonyl-CoA mutase, partial [Candidatus Marinimicrobia bacterium]|nr:methylmalonyl-CoA mutase [Candidatus Neomarinimicrobiota bacterium]
EEDTDTTTQSIDLQVEQNQLERLARVKAERDSEAVARNLAALTEIARGNGNLLPPIIDCVRGYTTLGEISQALKAVFGEYRPH